MLHTTLSKQPCWHGAHMVSPIRAKLMIVHLPDLLIILPSPTNPVRLAEYQAYTLPKHFSALKIYYDGNPLDMEKVEKIDTGLAAQNLRYPLYGYVHYPASENPGWSDTTAKFEEFLEDRITFADAPIEPREARLEIARRFGKLHSATDIEGVNKDQYREHGETWWNTYETGTHLGNTQAISYIAALSFDYRFKLFSWIGSNLMFLKLGLRWTNFIN